MHARFNSTAKSLGLDSKKISMWAPFKKKDSKTLNYVSYYNSSFPMDPGMWAPNYPSPGQDCVRCTYEACMDDSCGINQPVHTCSFPLGPPIAQLQGLCKDSILGNFYQTWALALLFQIHSPLILIPWIAIALLLILQIIRFAHHSIALKKTSGLLLLKSTKKLNHSQKNSGSLSLAGSKHNLTRQIPSA